MLKVYQYKNVVVETIQRNKRRINAYARQNQIKRIKVYIMLFLIMTLNINSVFAIENTNIYYGDYKILCDKDPYMYIKYDGKMQPNYKYYYFKDNKKYPVYCLNLGLKGAEEYELGYTVDGNDKIKDEKLQMIILNSYPYKSVEELELNNENEAIFASQFAIWCYMENLNINLIEPISDMNNKIVEVIKNIYNSRDRNINEFDIDLDMNYQKQEVEEKNGKLYYYRKINLESKNINVINLYTEDNNIIIEKLNDKQEYKISIPIDKVDSNYYSKIKLEINAKENIALFGKTKLDGFQNVAITLKDNFDAVIEKEIDFEKYESTIIINKKDKDTKENLSGVEFLITDEKDNVLEQCVTDENGIITFKVYNTDIIDIKIKETKAKEKYRDNNNEYEIEIYPNDFKSIDIYNEKQKGTIEIIKKTKEYNKYTSLPENTPLSNVEFNVLDEENNIVDTLITNEYGYAKTKELPIGKYYIQEIKTNEYYEIFKENILVEITSDEDNINVQVLNDNVYIEDKLPVTGR